MARYEGWISSDHIGDPLPGAREFAEEIAEVADIVIFTSRTSQETGEYARAGTPGQRRVKIIEWLEKHKIPYTDVYVGKGKPRASAFVDDRAVACSPQTNKKAFSEAITNVRKILRRKPKDQK